MNSFRPVHVFLPIILSLNCLAGYCADSADSLRKLLVISNNDTSRIGLLLQLGEYHSDHNQTDSALFFAEKAFELSTRNKDKARSALALKLKGDVFHSGGDILKSIRSFSAALRLYVGLTDFSSMAGVYNALGMVYDDQGNTELAVRNYTLAIKYYKKAGDVQGMAHTQYNRGMAWHHQGNYNNALKNYLAALKLYEQTKDVKGIADSYNTLGNLFGDQLEPEKAIEYYQASLKLSRQLDHKYGIGIALNNIGITYQDQGDYDAALENYLASLKIDQELMDLPGQAYSYTNVGVAYSLKGMHNQALENYSMAMKIRDSIGLKTGLPLLYNNIAQVYLDQKKVQEARRYALLSLETAKEFGATDEIMDSYLSIAMCDSAEGKWQNAYQNYKSYKQFGDSLYNLESSEKRAELFARYEGEKKEAQIKLLQKDKEKQAVMALAESKRNKIVLGSVLGGLLLVLLFSVFMFRRWQITQKQKKIIESQKLLVDEQKHILEGKNKDITDSITYAKRIQQAKLPSRELISQRFPESFILFKPKDIVSGDFYFFQQKENAVYLAAADCTGHGVPGAFMSLISSDKLEDAISSSYDTGEVIGKLNKSIKNSMSVSGQGETTRDGLDISLCRIEPREENYSLQYSGANRPLWINRAGKDQLEEIRGTKKAIGGFTDDHQQFEQQEIQLKKGDTFYIFSDGYADTFGGEKDKKLTTKRFRELLLSIRHLTMPEQGSFLDDFINRWKGNTEQIDDILVIGVRV